MPNTIYTTTSTELTSVANAIRTKGGTSAQLEYPDGFVDAIEDISTIPTLQSKTVTPTQSSQTVQADSGYDGLSSVTINGDANLLAENIKKDVSIFNTTGTYEGSGGGTVTATANMGMYTLCYTDANGQYQTAAGQVSFITVVVPANSLLIFLCDDMRVPSVTNMTAVASYSMGDRASYPYVRIYQAVQA